MTMYATPFIVEFLGTPEAGKTTTIQRIKAELEKKINLSVIRESAEVVPNYFQKNSIDSHFWMRLTTARSILEQKALLSAENLLLVDRGIVDATFWNYFFYTKGNLDFETVSHANAFFENICGLPNLAVFLSTTPEEAIRRRGSEGTIVTFDFVKSFNNELTSFMKNVSIPVYHLDTTNLSESEVFQKVVYEILRSYQAFRN